MKCVSAHMCTYLHAHICVCVHVYMYVYIYTWRCVCVRVDLDLDTQKNTKESLESQNLTLVTLPSLLIFIITLS